MLVKFYILASNENKQAYNSNNNEHTLEGPNLILCLKYDRFERKAWTGENKQTRKRQRQSCQGPKSILTRFNEYLEISN